MSSVKPPEERERRARRAPADSVFYDRIFPMVLIVLGIITVLLILAAAGILFGIIHYR